MKYKDTGRGIRFRNGTKFYVLYDTELNKEVYRIVNFIHQEELIIEDLDEHTSEVLTRRIDEYYGDANIEKWIEKMKPIKI